MKNSVKTIIIILLLLSFVLILTGCNNQMIDTNWKFDYAWVKLPTGEIVEGDVQSWYDGSDDEAGIWVQVKIDGKTYITSWDNVAMRVG